MIVLLQCAAVLFPQFQWFVSPLDSYFHYVRLYHFPLCTTGPSLVNKVTMQLTTGLEYQPQAANDLTTTTTTASSFQTLPNPLNLTVAGPIQMDLVVSTAASQPDIRISLPVTTQSAASLDTQQQATAVPSIMVDTRPLHSGNGGGIGSALVLKRQSSASGRR